MKKFASKDTPNYLWLVDTQAFQDWFKTRTGLDTTVQWNLRLLRDEWDYIGTRHEDFYDMRDKLLDSIDKIQNPATRYAVSVAVNHFTDWFQTMYKWAQGKDKNKVVDDAYAKFQKLYDAIVSNLESFNNSSTIEALQKALGDLTIGDLYPQNAARPVTDTTLADYLLKDLESEVNEALKWNSDLLNKAEEEKATPAPQSSSEPVAEKPASQEEASASVEKPQVVPQPQAPEPQPVSQSQPPTQTPLPGPAPETSPQPKPQTSTETWEIPVTVPAGFQGFVLQIIGKGQGQVISDKPLFGALGEDRFIEFKPAPGWELADVKLNGLSFGNAFTTLPLFAISSNMKIEVVFRPKQ